jgi:hypothetical protein
MDTKFYHLYIDTDISHAKNFLQSANIGEGHLDLAGGGARPPSPLATGLGLTLFYKVFNSPDSLTPDQSKRKINNNINKVSDSAEPRRLQQTGPLSSIGEAIVRLP